MTANPQAIVIIVFLVACLSAILAEAVFSYQLGHYGSSSKVAFTAEVIFGLVALILVSSAAAALLLFYFHV